MQIFKMGISENKAETYTVTSAGYVGSFQQNINLTTGSHDPVFIYTHFTLSQLNVNHKAK
jgi:hypothetical protein